jgi:EmrB/QacA subfamily drug resistance transporter
MTSHQRRTLLVCCVGFFMVLLDLTIVNTALPTIELRLHAGFNGLQWVVDCYSLAFAALLLTGGTFADRFGRKRLFQIGIVMFAASSLLCGLSTSILELQIGRTIQGIGAAALAPATLSLLSTAFPVPRERVRAVSLYTALSSTALGFGPTIGGALVTGPGWRWVFFVNVPIAIACVLFGFRYLTESTNPNARRIDPPGQVLSIAGLTGLTFGLIERGTHTWSDGRVAIPLAAGVLLLIAFLVVESRVAEPMLPLRLFRSRAFSSTATITLVAGFVTLTIPFFLTQYFQGVQGMTALQAGVRSLPYTVTIMVLSPLAGRLANRFGFYFPIAVGASIGAVGFWLLSSLHPHTAYSDIWWRQVITGASSGLVLSSLAAAGLAAVEPARAGLASSVGNTARQVGGVISIALLGTVLTTKMHASALSSLKGLPSTERFAAAEAIARSGARPVLTPLAGVSPARVREIGGIAYTAGTHTVWLITAGALVVNVIIALVFQRGAYRDSQAAASTPTPTPAPEAAPVSQPDAV